MPQKTGPRAICRDSDLTHPGTDLAAFVLSHPYNSRLGFCALTPEGEPALLDPAQAVYRYSVYCNLSLLLSPSFLDREILGEGTNFLALCTGLNFQGCEAVGISNRSLQLLVSSPVYERLGLVGTQSKHNPGDGLQAGLPSETCLCGPAALVLLTDRAASADQYFILVKLDSKAFRAKQGSYHRVWAHHHSADACQSPDHLVHIPALHACHKLSCRLRFANSKTPYAGDRMPSEVHRSAAVPLHKVQPTDLRQYPCGLL